MEFISKTQHYLKVKKPLLERQRRVRINTCLDSMKYIMAELQNSDTVLRMDKGDILETTIAYIRQTKSLNQQKEQLESFRNGYINAANEVSRVLVGTSGMSAKLGKSVMTHLGCQFIKLQEVTTNRTNYVPTLVIGKSATPPSPYSSGYYSDVDSLDASNIKPANIWRPW